MSPEAGMMLVSEIMPIIQATVPRTVKAVNSEDREELVEDTLASAAAMLDAAERAGKPLYPKSVAYYAIQRAKTGRRSYGATRTDVMAPATQLDNHAQLDYMDAPVATGEYGLEDGCELHAVLADRGEDPAQQAARELDWAELLLDLNDRDITLLRCTAEGRKLNALARKYGVSAARLTQIKREIGVQIKMRWGEEALADALREPTWKRGDIRCNQEREACRYDRN